MFGSLQLECTVFRSVISVTVCVCAYSCPHRRVCVFVSVSACITRPLQCSVLCNYISSYKFVHLSLPVEL